MEKEVIKEKTKETDIDGTNSFEKTLVLYDDDYHTFAFVIQSLVEICDLPYEQAEQITFLVHFKGKCEVRKGDVEYLKPMHSGLSRRGLKASIH